MVLCGGTDHTGGRQAGHLLPLLALALLVVGRALGSDLWAPTSTHAPEPPDHDRVRLLPEHLTHWGFHLDLLIYHKKSLWGGDPVWGWEAGTQLNLNSDLPGCSEERPRGRGGSYAQ